MAETGQEDLSRTLHEAIRLVDEEEDRAMSHAQAIRGRGDPAVRARGDPAVRARGGPGVRGRGQPAVRGRGQPAVRGAIPKRGDRQAEEAEEGEEAEDDLPR